MGYRISTIKNLPKDLNCYCFLVGDYRNSSMVNDLFRDGFRIVADRLGQDVAIIESTERGHMEWDLAKSLHDKLMKKSALSDYILQFESRNPGLLIMWKHPSKLTEKDALIHVPFAVLEDTYSNTTALLTDLVSFVNGKNTDFIEKIKSKYKIIKGLSFSINIGIFSLNIDL